MWKCAGWVLLLLISIEGNQCARILGILPIRCRSHYIISRRIVTALASRGHQVTVLSGIEEKQIYANYTHIYMNENLHESIDSYDIEQPYFSSVMDVIKEFREMEPVDCPLVLSQEHVKNITSSKLKMYDLIFAEMYFHPCYMALAAHLNIPVIWFVAPSSNYPIDYFTGNPHHPAYFPLITSGLSNDLSFMERLMNFYQTSVVHYYLANEFIPATVDQFNKQFNASVTLEQIHQLPNLAFTYGHFTLFLRPNLPNVVEIGGVHIEEKKPLPQDIKDFIENAEHGVIFFSFGTALKCGTISEKNMKMFIEVFSKIQQRVLWKCDISNHKNVPATVMIRQWLPQRDILAHRNVRAFISHGGILGTYEAIYTATPVIGIPFMYDQETDVRLLEKNGAAIRVNYQDLTVDVLFKSITEIINNPRYKENAERLSAIFKDRPMSPLDTAIYWIEYVIRHNGASHLRSPAAGMPLYRYLLLDVIGFLTICVSFVCYIIFLSCRKLLTSLHRCRLLQYAKEKSP